MRGRFTSLAIAIVLTAGIGVAVGGQQFLAGNSRQSASPTAARPPGPRIWYSAGQSPALGLPDGRLLTIHSVLNVRRKLAYGDFIWNDDAVPQGPRIVRIDLKRQLISVFRGGHEIGTAVILYGADSMPSPTGTYPVIQKAADYHSRTYDAPMPYTLRLTADGVAIHGSDVRRGRATHGCIGVPLEFARRLFGEMKLGDPVAILHDAA